MNEHKMVLPATVDPLSAILPSINATIKILEVTYQLKAVNEQTDDLLSTTRHVDFMVKEAHRLRRLKAGLLNASERAMIDKVISDTEDALRAVAKLVESCRVDRATKNSIRFGHRVMWVFRDNPNVRDKHQKLQVCHQSLTVAFTCLYSKDVVVIAPAPERSSEEQPPPYDPLEVLGWQNRRNRRRSHEERGGHAIGDKDEEDAGSNANISAGHTSPHLLEVPLENDGETPNHSGRLSEMFCELPTMSTPNLPSLVSRNNACSLRSAGISPELNHRSQITEDKFHADTDIERTSSATQKDASIDHIDPIHNLPEIDSAPFSTMMAPFTLHSSEGNRPENISENSARVSFPTRGRDPTLSAVVPDTTPSDPSFSPTRPLSATATPTLSSLEVGHDDRLGGCASSRFKTYDEPTETASLGQHPSFARINSDTQLPDAYQNDRLDAIARVEDFVAREKRAVSVGQGVGKRGGRSWLAYHATRSDTGHGMDWNG